MVRPVASILSIIKVLKTLADGLEVIARDPKDDIIEAVQSTDESRFLGVQWHPELRLTRAPAGSQAL